MYAPSRDFIHSFIHASNTVFENSLVLKGLIFLLGKIDIEIGDNNTVQLGLGKFSTGLTMSTDKTFSCLGKLRCLEQHIKLNMLMLKKY